MYQQEVEDLKSEYSRADYVAKVKHETDCLVINIANANLFS